MTSFGKWLGAENGKQMLSAVFDDCTLEQARAAVTSYCCIFGIKVDTKEWIDLMDWIWDCYNRWFNIYDEMDAYMKTDLV